MMQSLAGRLSPNEMEMVTSLVDMRFEDSKKFLTAESVILYEQRILDEDTIFDCCCLEMDMTLERPRMSYLSQEIINRYDEEECVPFRLENTGNNKLHVMVVPEFKSKVIPPHDSYELERHYVPLYYYVLMRTKYYRTPDWLYKLVDKDIFEYIVNEAISLGAIDITIASRRDSGEIYYNVRKKKVYSKRSITKSDVLGLVKYMSSKAGAAFEEDDLRPKYMNIAVDDKHRGRTCIKNTIWGKAVTIRVLDNEPMDIALEDLNLKEGVIKFIRDRFMDLSENGLRLLIGPTMSGKNTTIVAMLREFMIEDLYKVSTVEMPVEIFLDKAEQTSVDDEEMYMLNAMALLRENPDICYLSEITNSTAETILTTANTAKPIYSSIHANSIPDIISRLVDLTGFSIDRVISCLHSVIFQNLVRDDVDDVLNPANKCFEFTDSVKLNLYGKTLGEIQRYFIEGNIELITE